MSEVRLRSTKWALAMTVPSGSSGQPIPHSHRQQRQPHWEATLTLLGEDEHGVWLGGRAGVTYSKPGESFDTTGASTVLVPRERPWVATFYGGADFGHVHDCRVYVDMTTHAVWSQDGAVVTMVDLDLDVIQHNDGSVHVDDEDEFGIHQVELAYPPEIIAMAERSRDEVLHAIRHGSAPFDELTHLPWLARLT